MLFISLRKLSFIPSLLRIFAKNICCIFQVFLCIRWDDPELFASLAAFCPDEASVWGWSLKSLQSCPTLCEPMDCSPRGSSVHRILRARILVRVAVPSSRGCSRPRDQIHISRGPCNAGGLLTTEPPGKPFLSLTAEFMLQEQLVPCPQWIKTAPSGDGRERSRKSFLFLCISTVLLTQVCTRWAFLRACRGVSVGRVYEKMHTPRAV